jgi:uncharacterized membrane protein YfcA
MEIPLLIMTGALIGLIVGVTGVGGGALMTPALMLFGYPAHVAIGTDLWFAAITKSSGMYAHHKKGHIDWQITMNLAAGSIPAAILTGLGLAFVFGSAENYSGILKTALGFMLIATSAVLLGKNKLAKYYANKQFKAQIAQNFSVKLFISGIVLGVLVTLSSVGAGAIGTAVLMILFPHLLPKQVVGTDIAHAVPLTFIAGAIHLYLGNVDFALLLALLVGSLPAIHLGTAISSKLPNRLLHPVLASLLMIIGMRYALF